ncbi:MAG: helix-turn-helix transcriptional regulator [Planctomycetes bacterium]|nr:helix-turn-helix transcriptional regulator [Planctomycetota bacterium]
MAPTRFDLLATPPLPLLANFYPFRRGEIAGPHWSASDLYLATTQGTGVVRVGPERFTLEAGSLLHVPWSAPVEYHADRRQPFVLIGVHLAYDAWSQRESSPPLHARAGTDFARRSMQDPPTAQPFDGPFVLPSDGTSRCIDLATELAQAFSDHADVDRSARLRALALRFLIEVRAQRRGAARSADHPAAGTVRKLVSWLELSLASPISRPEMAARAGMSETALAAAFRAVTGASPIDYLIELRLSHAARLLRTSTLRVGDIARRVGIPDIYHFSKLFKKRKGLPPLRYRARMFP